jgi:hypothetical protein
VRRGGTTNSAAPVRALTRSRGEFDTPLFMEKHRKPVRFLGAGLAALALAAMGCAGDAGSRPASPPAAPPATPSNAPVTLPQTPGVTTSNDQQQVMEVNKAVVVTVEVPAASIAEAIRNVERRHQPADGQGRTFAILDAFGDPAGAGKVLMSMHVSSEKPGLGQLVYKPTGQMLWSVKVVPGEGTSQAFTGKDLRITIDDGKGNARTVDGSKNPPTVLAATIKELNVPVSAFWPEGEIREVTFFYSACGCPIHVKARRTGNQIVRTSDLPIIFPDDPAAVTVINKLMQW